MGQTRCQLTHGDDTIDMCQFGSQLTSVMLSLFPLGDVLANTKKADDILLRIPSVGKGNGPHLGHLEADDFPQFRSSRCQYRLQCCLYILHLKGQMSPAGAIRNRSLPIRTAIVLEDLDCRTV